MQTASILSKELALDIAVETDLHEWLANKNYIYESDEAAEKAYEEYGRFHGAYPDGQEMTWESSAAVKRRALVVLRRYASYEKVIVACHGMLIQAVTGGGHPGFGEIAEFDI